MIMCPLTVKVTKSLHAQGESEISCVIANAFQDIIVKNSFTSTHIYLVNPGVYILYLSSNNAYGINSKNLMNFGKNSAKNFSKDLGKISEKISKTLLKKL